MQPYQEEYISNLRDIAERSVQRKQEELSFEEFCWEIARNERQLERTVRRNMELLKEGLFPVLDHLYEADSEQLAELLEFAGMLMNPREELDVGLFCQIHRALLSVARFRRDRRAMIRELYWLGIGRNSMNNKLVGLESSKSEEYIHRMRLCFTEAAAYLKYFDEIEDAETRGYILRARANMALGQYKSVTERIRIIKRTLQIMQDKEYQEKAPELPWDRYIYQTHQLMAASMSHSKGRTMTPQDIADIMESVHIVLDRRIQETAERGEKPPVRTAFSNCAIEYYCGLDTLDGLLTKMERLTDTVDASDYSTDGMYGTISIPAFYCQYLQENPEKIPEREEYIEDLYRRIVSYVENFPGEGKESMFYYLRQLSLTFIETPNSLSYGDFIIRLQELFTPEIFVHSYVVGKAAAEFCGIIAEEQPGFFDDIDELRRLREPERKRAAILDYAMKCGQLHDVGKMNFISLYKTPRQWFEEEYEMAHLHTMIGAAWLEMRESTRHYAMVAMGHHCWYDGSRGYPETYRRLECPYRQMVDVIGLLDWLDNVTASSRRLYTGKERTFDVAVKEAVSLEGRRFSPILTAMLRDGEIAERLARAFAQGRQEAYLRLYREGR